MSSLADFALEHHTDYKTLKLLNPWLREESLTVKEEKIYDVKIPSADFHQLPPEQTPSFEKQESDTIR